MKNLRFVVLAFVLFSPRLGLSQVSGNLAFSQSGAKARAEQREQNKRLISEKALPPTGTTTFVEADVLMNVKADEFVAVFGLVQDGATVEECGQKMDATVKEFTASLQALKVDSKDLFLDFVTQTKIYGFEVMGNVSREKLVGFELKKNILVHYTDRLLLDKLVVAAARSKIYDLIKVDYIVRDIKPIQDKLMEEAATIIQQKSARYEKLLGIKLQPPAQIFAEKYATHFPSEMYDSQVAAESEEIDFDARQKGNVVQRARKGRTFVLNGLDGDGFDQVINPAITEPVVQFTLYLKVKYEVEQLKAK
ncbi:MAG: hypothetical protein JWM11_7007 [Planctomycetaceae bacterium]|nr:hypothetical protein [Planctomycetaceae bacterium]